MHDDVLQWRRNVLNKAKLKQVTNTSALLSGFAMVAMVEEQLDFTQQYPPGLLMAYTVMTCLLVAVHLLALMVSTCILPHIEANMEAHQHEKGDDISDDYLSGQRHLHFYIESAWIASTGVGIFLFLIELCLICWVRFVGTSQGPPIAATIVVAPVAVVFLFFAFHFYYRLLVTEKYDQAAKRVARLEKWRSTFVLDAAMAEDGEAATALMPAANQSTSPVNSSTIVSLDF